MVFSRGAVVGSLAGPDLTERGVATLALTSSTGTRKETRPRSAAARIVGGDWVPSIALGAATLLLGLAAAITNDRYLTGLNFRGLLALLGTLVFVAFGQQIVMMTGGIDLSVGPLMGFLVIVSSFFVTQEDPVGPMWLGWLLMLFGALAVGLVNWSLVDVAGLHPVVATLVTFMALRGVSLLLRPVPGGLIDTGITDRISSRLGFVPIAIVVGVGAAVLLEYALRRSWWGVATRATGSHSETARASGIPVKMVRLASYLACAVLSGLAAVSLMAQVGSGTPQAGVDYTLISIAAVVLGGTSIFGGRGSFIGTLMGALLLQQVIVATTFLGLAEEWRSFLLGGLTLLAVAAYSRVREAPT
jgi:ribose transport system ATP-binding protein